MKLTIRELRQIIREAIMKNVGLKSLPDDMPHITQYGGELGNDDGTGESGGDEDINEALGSSKKPTTFLGHSVAFDDDPEYSDEDLPAKPMAMQTELFEPGFEEFPRFMDHSAEDVDSPKNHNKELDAWNTIQDLYDTVKDTWGLQSMSDPRFIDYALEELRQNGTPDGVMTRMRFRLENNNGG